MVAYPPWLFDFFAVSNQPDTPLLFKPPQTPLSVISPAAGLTSTGIVVRETGSTPVGHSIQLSGTGNKLQDFTWQSAGVSTFNSVNANQTFTSVPEPGLVVLTGFGLIFIGFVRRIKHS